MIKFKRNPKTGELLVFKDGKPNGKIITMGDLMTKKPKMPEEKQKKKEGKQ